MTCQKCGEETDELHRVKLGRRTQRLCEDCYLEVQQEQEIAAEAAGVVRDMMEYKG